MNLQRKFEEIPYTRPDLEKMQNDFEKLISDFQKADTFDEQAKLVEQWNSILMVFETAENLASIHHDKNISDLEAKTENDFFSENKPSFQGWNSDFGKVFLKSGFKKELSEKFGKQIFKLIEAGQKTFSPEVKDLLSKENQLVNDYTEILASAEIHFDGKVLNLAGMEPYTNSLDRSVRKKSLQAKWNYLSENSNKIDEIYDELVKIRTEIAHKLGFESFTDLAYTRLRRTDYLPKDVEKFRKQVERVVVPLVARFKEEQRKKLGLSELKYHDETIQYVEGNPVPKGEPEWIVSQAQKMYSELSPETGEFFDTLVNLNLMDLVNRPKKAGGGYCTKIPEIGLPFIYSNFNGTDHDVKVLTHEAGHAFQSYQSRNQPLLDYGFPTMEAAEINSMSMEFLTWDFMEYFFGEDAEKFRKLHLKESILFLPYGTAVDEFQHLVYANPTSSPKERKKMWQSVEKKYLPYRKYEDIPFLEEGGIWQLQRHIFFTPFYYIDYCLAQTCALQFLVKNKENKDLAFKDYLRICEVGGSLSFLEILELGNLKSPFDENCVEEVIEKVKKWL
ncbi:M3 family oligoendopeptidase [bacterium]|nr:M3 family oligoendopeptidase [bacterium]